jgi:hypothetical protein
MEFLSRFKFIVKHIPGATNPADPISRLFAVMAIQTMLDIQPEILQQIRDEYSKEPAIWQHGTKVTRRYAWLDGLWHYQNRVVVPQSMVETIIAAHHDAPTAGHFGSARTVSAIQRNFYWKDLRSDVDNYIKHCPSCQRNKSETRRPAGLLQPLQIPDSRWETVSMDFITCLPKSHMGSDAILVFVDKLTKMVHLAPTTIKCTAEQAAQLFLTHVFRLHGMPLHFISDRDPRFTSNFWQHLCKNLDIKTRFSTAYHPQTDGQTERTNRVIEEVLRQFVESDERSWEDKIPLVEFAMNNAVNASSQETPFFLNYGLHPRTPVTVQLPTVNQPVLETVLQDMAETLEKTKKLLRAAQDRQKHYADPRRRPHEIAEGMRVLLSSKNLNFKGKSRKLYPKFIGPFEVLRMVGKNAAELILPENFKIHNVFHVSLLRPYNPRIDIDEPPLPELVDGLPYYKVEHILAHRDRRKRNRRYREYLIKWQGYSDDHNSWEPARNLTPDLIEGYTSR